MKTVSRPLSNLASLMPTFVLACVLAVGTAPVRAESVIGLTTANGLVTFDSASPGTVSAVTAITGLGNEKLYDIDYRPANRVLYGLSDAGRLYSINTLTGAALLSATLTVALDPAATRFGIDFNPTVDRVRIVSNTGQDLRLTPDTTINGTTTDPNLTGAATGAVSVAYTNNFNNPGGATALFYIGPGTSPSSTFTTANANLGVLTSVGPLNFTSTQDVGFDISGLTGNAFASLTNPTGGGSSFYSINLGNGAATLVGNIDTGLSLRGIALLPGVPEPSSLVLASIGLVGVALSVIRRRRLPTAP